MIERVDRKQRASCGNRRQFTWWLEFGAEMKGMILNKGLTAGKCKGEEYEKVTEPE
jgi:hypothetical protein